jgi:hypothetical protein
MMGLISFLREHKVTVIEIQHGFINPHHAMYINWPSESSSAKSLRPNVFWSWSALANKMLDIANYPCHTGEKVFVGGYPWSYLRAKNLKFFETQNNTEITRSKPEYRSIRVLLTLGALQTEECEDLPDYLLELIYLRTDISFTLLPHPNDPNPRRYLESRFVTGQPENVIVAQINTDLYSLLDNSTHHITAMSTAAIEAQYLGIPTLMSSKLGQVLFSSLIDNRLIFVSYGNRESVENFLNQKRVPVQTKSTYISSSAELLENGIKICVKAAKL